MSERVKRWAASFVECDNLAVNYRFVRQRRQRFYNAGVPAAKLLAVAGSEVDTAGGFKADGAIAVELVFPARTADSFGAEASARRSGLWSEN